jgi:hypothetical protein
MCKNIVFQIKKSMVIKNFFQVLIKSKHLLYIHVKKLNMRSLLWSSKSCLVQISCHSLFGFKALQSLWFHACDAAIYTVASFHKVDGSSRGMVSACACKNAPIRTGGPLALLKIESLHNLY